MRELLEMVVCAWRVPALVVCVVFLFIGVYLTKPEPVWKEGAALLGGKCEDGDDIGRVRIVDGKVEVCRWE